MNPPKEAVARPGRTPVPQPQQPEPEPQPFADRVRDILAAGGQR